MEEMGGPLRGVRVLDLATARGEMAGRVLADLGADVLKVEPPGGGEGRRLPPFDERPGPSRGESLWWAALATGKRSTVADLSTLEGVARVQGLASSADVFIESSAPGEMAALGLGYADLSAANPGLIYVSITPFGQDGPLARAPATDLTVEAAGGLIGMQGDGDRPPIPVGFPQASFHAGAQAAADTVIALNERLRSGLGQHLDTSAQAAVVWTLMNATGYPPNTGGDPPGFCGRRAEPTPQLFPGLSIPRIVRTADGWAIYNLTLPAIGPRTLHVLARWMEECGQCPERLRGADWSRWTPRVAAGDLPVGDVVEIIEALARFIAQRTNAEVQALAVEHEILISPVYTVPELLADPHLEARGYWHRQQGRVQCGAFARLSATPLREPGEAPAIGTAEDWTEREHERPSATASAARRPAFEGLRVADFSWVGVGPIIAKALADHGATVVHVESANHPDVLRLVPPFKDGVPGINRSQFMPNFNSSKLGISLDIATDEGLAIARRLVDWADVVVESFTPGTLAKFGLDYAALRERKPDLVMLSTCLRGQTGPERRYTGFGGQGAALAGVYSLTGWPDRPPVGPWGAYTDFITPRFGVAALASAIYHRQRTGEGQYIDVSQVEAGIRFIEPLVMDFATNGRAPMARGMASLYAAPHGVFRSAGDERYVAISVESAEQWRALCGGVAGLSAFEGPEFEDSDRRRDCLPEIDDAITGWTCGREAFEAAETLRAAGVPAYAVLWPSDLYCDPQLTAREFFVMLDHGEMGPTPYDGLATRFSATPGRLAKAGPCLGEDTEPVLRDVLGLEEGEIAAAAAAGALT